MMFPVKQMLLCKILLAEAESILKPSRHHSPVKQSDFLLPKASNHNLSLMQLFNLQRTKAQSDGASTR